MNKFKMLGQEGAFTRDWGCDTETLLSHFCGLKAHDQVETLKKMSGDQGLGWEDE